MTLTPQGLSLLSLVLLIFPMGYFLITSPTFLFVRLDIPQVRTLMRTHFSGFLLWLAAFAGLSAVVAAAAGRPSLAALPATIFIVSIVARRWFLARFDREIAAQDRGDPAATRRMRRLHVGGMLTNAAALAVVIVTVNPVLASIG